jgi:hypothetical protein
MRIRKSTLKRIIAETTSRGLDEMYGGSPPVGGAPSLGRDKKVEYVSGAYMMPGKGFVTDSEDHPLDQLQDLLDMGVRTVEDGESDMGVMPIMKWKDIVVDVTTSNNEDAIYGPPRRWRG